LSVAGATKAARRGRGIMRLLTVVGLILSLAATAAFAADDDGPNFTVGASMSYVYDFNDPDPDLDDNSNSLSYANLEPTDESFNIDLLQLGIHGTRDEAFYGAKIDFGDLARLAGDSADGDVGLQEAYLGYGFGMATVTAGRFPTPIGYEVLEPWHNANISRSRAWVQFVPISHDGLSVSGRFADTVDASIGVVNSTFVNDPAGNDNNDDKGVVGSLGIDVSDVSMSLAGLYSEEDLGFDDDDQSILNFIVSSPVGAGHLALEGNWARDDLEDTGEFDFWNIVLYAGFDLGRTGIDLRGDYGQADFEDEDDVGIWSATATLSWKLVESVEFRFEYRHEEFDENFFADDNDPFSEKSVDLLQAQLVMSPEI
jgi:hypothetical protein